LHTYGIMQGRLVPPENGRFQSFPRNAWREEFSRARTIGLDYIEWIHDHYGLGANPIFTSEGLAEFDALKREYSIATPALCSDWFMDFPLIRCTNCELRFRERHLQDLIPVAARIGAKRIVLPFVDQSKIVTEGEKRQVIEVLNRALPIARKHHVELHLEADLNPADFAAFMARIPHSNLKITWDSGNSSGLGYIATEEFAAYGDRIGSIHIKDRLKNSEGDVETRPLGAGSADFDDIFSAIHNIGYAGGLTLQVARGTANEEVNFIEAQLSFIKRYC
jgi:L-ribulose-5-phosphate 3-epimerase